MAPAMQASDIPRLDQLPGWPLPEERVDWFGETAPEAILRAAYLGDRMHHAWLITGGKGVGKATLAFRAARFVLAHPDEKSDTAAGASPLAVSPSDRVFRQVTARAHPNLLTLERPWDDKQKRFKTELPVDEIRRTIPFFGSTAGETGWRVCIVDVADDLSASAANALLKIVEEPPPRSVFFLLAHAPGRLLPTIRSRCRRLDLAPLSAAAIEQALATAPAGQQHAADERRLAAAAAGGSLRRAILHLEHDGASVTRDFLSIAAGLPRPDLTAIHKLADKVSARGADDVYENFLGQVFDWLDRRVRGAPEPGGAHAADALAATPLERWAEVWEKVQASSAEADELNLDRKQVVLSIFTTLAHATRM